MGIPEILFSLLLVIYFVALPPIFTRAGQDGWKGYVPVYQYITWLKILKRPWWWIFLLFVPFVNLIMFTILHVETSIAFGKRSAKDQWFAGVLPWVFLPMLAFKDKEAKYVGPRDWTGKKKSFAREWGEAIVFAVVAASVIRTFFFEAFTIPTPSMEGSMLVGDYLFVSKVSYGAKVPMTPVAVPFVHNRIPGTMNRSFVEWFELPYFRLPGFGDVDRMDPVVFNFPHGDTVMLHDPLAGHDYYQYLRKEAIHVAGGYDRYLENKEASMAKARENIHEKNKVTVAGAKLEGIDVYPIDKNEHYVKRCVGLPGETFEIRDRVIYANNEAIDLPEKGQFVYQVEIEQGQHLQRIMEEFELVPSEIEFIPIRAGNSIVPQFPGPVRFPLDDGQVKRLESFPFITSEVIPVLDQAPIPSTELPVDSLGNKDVENQGLMFPYSDNPKYRSWTVDNWGPVQIPAEGLTIELSSENIDEYRRTIEVYEGNELEVKEDGTILINGNVVTSYTFKYDYFFMMGDNRHASLDSRYWGWVPETHIVGKPVLTWLSKNQAGHHGNGDLRWDRMFKLVD